MSNALVGVCMITYNHEAYVSGAIESIISQIADFEYVLVIGEDFSKDATRAICEKYAALYPDKIRLLPSDKNYGMGNNAKRTIEACKEYKYLAICEGDDYWIDPYKLQKQINFLEKNPDYSVCVTAIEVVNDMGEHLNHKNPFQNFSKDTYTIEEYIWLGDNKNILLPIATFVALNTLPDELPEFFHTAVTGDIALTLLLLDKGKLKYINEVTAVYREHMGGISKSENFKSKMDLGIFVLYDSFNEYTNHKYHEAIKKRLYPLSKTLLMYGTSLLKGKERHKHISRMMKGYKKYRPEINYKEIFYYFIVLRMPFIAKLLKNMKSA